MNVVCLALLTGSDYTEGVETVGPVTAMEILAEFPGDGLAPLQEFAAWRGRVGAGLGGEVVGSRAREKLRRLQLPVSFPSLAVQAAYLQPSVDTSTQPFSWAVPNLVAVRSAPVLKLMHGPFLSFIFRDFAREKFGWDRAKIDRLLSPVVRALDSRLARGKNQSTLDTFVTSARVKLPDKGLAASSKRVEEAIRKVRGLKSPEEPKPVAKSKDKAASKKSNNSINPKKKATQPRPSGSITNAGSTEKAEEVSLIARSCGVVIAPSKDDIVLQKIEREKKAQEAKERAAEIFKKSQKAKQNKIQKKFKRPKRVELEGHGLSESDSD